MPPQSSAVLSASTGTVQSPATTKYSAERLAVIKLMAVMTALAVAFMAVVTTWFTELNAVSGDLIDSIWSGENRYRLVGGAVGIFVLAASMLVVWVRLVKRLVRMDWIG